MLDAIHEQHLLSPPVSVANLLQVLDKGVSVTGSTHLL